MNKFTGIIEYKQDYHALCDCNVIINLVYNFKNKFNATINNIGVEDNGNKLIFELDLCKLIFKNFQIKFEVFSDIDTFTNVYNWLSWITRYDDIKVGETVYDGNRKGMVKDTDDERFFKVLFDGEEKPEAVYKNWTLKFN